MPKRIAKTIIEGKGEYCLAVKANQQKLLEAIEACFDDVIESQHESLVCRQHQTQERSHGREEFPSLYGHEDPHVDACIPRAMA